MTAFSAQYGPVEDVLSTMTTQATTIETAITDLMKQVAAAASNFVGDSATSYQLAQSQINQGVLSLQGRLTSKIGQVHVIMGDNYQATDAGQAKTFGR
ncbi:MAG: hypothetical protein JWN95_3655 [Frankiales bacterium]|nr:hypothetical protein [Frankiales bacterium]